MSHISGDEHWLYELVVLCWVDGIFQFNGNMAFVQSFLVTCNFGKTEICKIMSRLNIICNLIYYQFQQILWKKDKLLEREREGTWGKIASSVDVSVGGPVHAKFNIEFVLLRLNYILNLLCFSI